MVAGLAKAYTLPFDYVLYDMSYANMTLYGSVLPQYDADKDKKEENPPQKVVKADDPANRELVRKFFEECD